jgi:signal transduction histidine kinase
MPGMSGVEFFNSVRQIYPEGIRVLITAYTDVKEIIDAVNKGNIYRFISKPWSTEEIHQTIKNGFDIYQTRQALNDKISQLEKTNEDLNRFIYSASHDLRAPLMSILGVVKLSELDPIDESAAKMFQMIESSVNRLDIFIQSIIEYYQNSRNLNENKEIDFEALVHDVLLNLHYYEGSEKIKFELDFHENGKFVGDEFRLRIILSNLISNAIKYRRVDLEKHIVRIVVNSSANQAAIKIEDNGVGILQEHLQNIFKMFFRADSYRSGSGIGLYIVKEALEKVGGEISVHSEINQGTQFEIKIPSVKMDSK